MSISAASAVTVERLLDPDIVSGSEDLLLCKEHYLGELSVHCEFSRLLISLIGIADTYYRNTGNDSDDSYDYDSLD